MTLRRLYLVLAAIGCFPLLVGLWWLAENGLAWEQVAELVWWNRLSAAFVADLLISILAFWPFVFTETRRVGGMPSPWVFVAVNCVVGLSCALPLFLYFRERELTSESLGSRSYPQ
ncbi:MAG: DUF2834 domain-containing protein [Sumerlaeia bacterium]